MKKLIFILLLFPSLCQAEQTSLTSYLTNEPVTLMDVGINGLSRHLNDLCKSKQDHWKILLETTKKAFYEAKASYDFDENKIILYIELHMNKDLAEDHLKVAAKRVFKAVRLRFGVNPFSGKLPGESFGLFYRLFTHSGYKGKQEPEKLNQQIANIVEINVVITNKNHVPLLTTKGKLVSSEVLFSK